MSDLTRFRDHCQSMATAEHAPDCPHITAREPYWPMWTVAEDGGSMVWNGPKPPWSPPPCGGCITDDDRALWTRLANEADAYLDREPEESLL